MRCQENEGMTELLGKLQKVSENVAAAYGAKAEFSLPGGVIPAAVLDKELTAEVAECIKEVVGEENLGEELVNPGGEDFHYFAKTYPKLNRLILASALLPNLGCTTLICILISMVYRLAWKFWKNYAEKLG